MLQALLRGTSSPGEQKRDSAGLMKSALF
jgi:hypothetical protein